MSAAETEHGRIDLAQAARAARDYLIELHRVMGDAEAKNIRLEEVEYDDDKEHWIVTLGYDRPITDPLRTIGLGIAGRTEREYKILTVDGITGRALNMKIRQL